MVEPNVTVMKARISRLLLWVFGLGCSIFFLNRFIIPPLEEAALFELEKQKVEKDGLSLDQGPNNFLKGKSKTLYFVDTRPFEGRSK